MLFNLSQYLVAFRAGGGVEVRPEEPEAARALFIDKAAEVRIPFVQHGRHAVSVAGTPGRLATGRFLRP